MGKYLDLIRKPVTGTTETTETTKGVSRGTLVVFGRFGRTLQALEARCPELIDHHRWQQAVEDGRAFLSKWGSQAEALGWTSEDLFGLHTPPVNPHPSYRRLSRYDGLGLAWLLQGKKVIGLTGDTATIRNPATGNVTVYRKFDKPAYGPVGDSLDDFV